MLVLVVPTLKTYVTMPLNENAIPLQWTNNNCESLNHIMKLDADWKIGKTFEVIELLYEITELHFKDFRRALYGSGHYRLVAKQKKIYGITKDNWRRMDEIERQAKFETFVRDMKKKQSDVITSTYVDFRVKKPTTARKPEQRKRVRSRKTNNRY